MKKITNLFTAALVLGCIFHLSADDLEDAVKFHVPFNGDCNAAVAEGGNNRHHGVQKSGLQIRLNPLQNGQIKRNGAIVQKGLQ